MKPVVPGRSSKIRPSVAGHRRVPALAGPVQDPHAGLLRLGPYAVHGAFGEAGVPLVDGGRLTDHRHLAVAEAA